MARKLRVLGLTCGIGSMLVGARSAGFKVVGNIEWRKYYHYKDSKGRNTFTENFPDAFMVHDLEDLDGATQESLEGVDLAMGHPECGNFSNLQTTTNNNTDAGDIPLFVDLIKKFRPKYFAMDDLPKSFLAYPMRKYAEELQDYDLFPEWVSNWGYGNIQKNRNRFFMLGALKSERFTFVPREVQNKKIMSDFIDGVDGLPNHEPHSKTDVCERASSLGEPGKKKTWGEVSKVFLKLPPGRSFPYKSADGQMRGRVGFLRTYWDKHSHVLTGGNAIVHPKTGLPLSIRERARIQGFPDNFIFYGAKLDDKKQWNHFANMHLVKQTGKAMPVQFNQFFAKQVREHIEGKPTDPKKASRILRFDPFINAAKLWYCKEGPGYAEQLKACQACWVRSTCPISKAPNLIRKQLAEEAPRVYVKTRKDKP